MADEPTTQIVNVIAHGVAGGQVKRPPLDDEIVYLCGEDELTRQQVRERQEHFYHIDFEGDD